MSKWKARAFTDEDLRESNSGAYTIKKGDTLWAISKRTGVPIERLMELNGIKDPSQLRVGLKLNLDSGLQGGMMRKPTEDPYTGYDKLRNVATSSDMPAAPDPFDVRANAVESTTSPLDFLAGGGPAALRSAGRGVMGTLRNIPMQSQAGRVAPISSNVMPYGGNMGAARSAARSALDNAPLSSDLGIGGLSRLAGREFAEVRPMQYFRDLPPTRSPELANLFRRNR